MGLDTIKFENKGKVKMIAHRGVSGLELENTCPAFVAAGVKSYYGIETDVHVTKDKKFIIVHDDDLKRIADLDINVEQSTFAELRKIRFKDTDGKTERADLFLPSLEEYISICKKYDKQAVLELKNTMEKPEVVGIVETVKRLGWYGRTTFISFSKRNMLTLKQEYPDCSAQYLTMQSTEEELQFVLENGLDVDFCGLCVCKEVVDKLHEKGRVVNCWTVDRVEDAELLRDMGVDQITSNILE